MTGLGRGKGAAKGALVAFSQVGDPRATTGPVGEIGGANSAFPFVRSTEGAPDIGEPKTTGCTIAGSLCAVAGNRLTGAVLPGSGAGFPRSSTGCSPLEGLTCPLLLRNAGVICV